jgi:hypothetical protein
MVLALVIHPAVETDIHNCSSGLPWAHRPLCHWMANPRATVFSEVAAAGLARWQVFSAKSEQPALIQWNTDWNFLVNLSCVLHPLAVYCAQQLFNQHNTAGRCRRQTRWRFSSGKLFPSSTWCVPSLSLWMWSALAFTLHSLCLTLYPQCAPTLRHVPHSAPRLQTPSLQTLPSSTAMSTLMQHHVPPLRRRHCSPRYLIVRRECIPSQVYPAQARLRALLFVYWRRYSPCSVCTS